MPRRRGRLQAMIGGVAEAPQSTPSGHAVKPSSRRRKRQRSRLVLWCAVIMGMLSVLLVVSCTFAIQVGLQDGPASAHHTPQR
jgi:hypothetical protein